MFIIKLYIQIAPRDYTHQHKEGNCRKKSDSKWFCACSNDGHERKVGHLRDRKIN